MITMEKLDQLKVNEQLSFTGNTQVIRNMVYRFHKRHPEKRIRVLSVINVVVRLV